MIINGKERPLSKKQSKNTNSTITGKVWADYDRMRELPDEKDLLWSDKGFSRIAGLAQYKAEVNGSTVYEELHKARWQVLFNQPSVYVLYTNKLDDTQIGRIKFCVTRGITVALEDVYMGYKEVLLPVDNLFNNELFKKFKAEEIDTTKLSEELTAQVQEAVMDITNARNNYMAQVWPLVNELLAPITNFYKEDKIETAYEARIWADRYYTQEILKQYGATISIYDLDKPEIFTVILAEVRLWAYAFDINIKLDSSETTSDTYKPFKWFKHDKNYVPTKATELKTIYRIKQAMKPAALNELLNAYIQIQFYKEHAEDFLSDSYYLCPSCGKPVNKQAECCMLCEWPNLDKEPELESYEVKQYMIEREAN